MFGGLGKIPARPSGFQNRLQRYPMLGFSIGIVSARILSSILRDLPRLSQLLLLKGAYRSVVSETCHQPRSGYRLQAPGLDDFATFNVRSSRRLLHRGADSMTSSG